MKSKKITGWNVKVARNLIDNERSTELTLRIFVPSEDKKVLRSFNVPKKFVTDNDKTKDYFYIWIPKTKWSQYCYSFEYVKGQYVQIGKTLVGFNKLVELMNICAHFTRQMLTSIKNGLNIIKDKTAQKIKDIIKMQKEFNFSEFRLKELDLELEQLVANKHAKINKIKESLSDVPEQHKLVLDENTNIEW